MVEPKMIEECWRGWVVGVVDVGKQGVGGVHHQKRSLVQGHII